MLPRTYRFLAVLALCAIGGGQVLADVVETKSGARLVGTITKIEGGTIFLRTDYAGNVKVKKAEVVGLQTEKVRFVRMADGTLKLGVLETADYGQIKVAGLEGGSPAPMSELTELWEPTDSELSQHRWHYEANSDVVGKSGNHEQLTTAFGARVRRIGGHDALQFYTSYLKQTTDAVTSADQFKIGVDYANNYEGRKSWYVRDESGFDRVKGIESSSVAAAGVGYDFVKNQRQVLTGRSGLSYRYERYSDPDTDRVNSFGLDLGLHHSVVFSDSKLVNDLTLVPAFSEFSNYNAVQESYFEIPLAMNGWKLRVGVSNAYNSMPGDNVEKLDTTYFSRFVLNWE